MVPLSEHEQRVLEQLERDLGADPKLGRTMSRGPRRSGRIVAGAIGVVVGLGVMLLGVVSQVIPLGIAGFALMIAAAMWVIFTPRKTVAKGPRAAGTPQRHRERESFMRRVEERLARRRESGDL